MKKMASFKMTLNSFLIFFVLGNIIACNDGTNDAADAGGLDAVDTMQTAMATITGTFPDSMVSGVAQFSTMAGGKVKMILHLTIPGKANQSVAVHIHEGGECGDTAKQAMGHWNPTDAQHGKWGSAGFHSGDIGNISLDAKGYGELNLETDLWSIGGDSQKNILNRTIIVHGGIDDYTSQPSGNAGTRIGCGVISTSGL